MRDIADRARRHAYVLVEEVHGHLCRAFGCASKISVSDFGHAIAGRLSLWAGSGGLCITDIVEAAAACHIGHLNGSEQPPVSVIQARLMDVVVAVLLDEPHCCGSCSGGMGGTGHSGCC